MTAPVDVQYFKLISFVDDAFSRALSVTVSVVRLPNSSNLSVTFQLLDPTNCLGQSIVEPEHQPVLNESTRQDYLWEHTCFEVFIQPISNNKDTSNTAYQEINLSPNGAWNVYQFDDYRLPKSMPPKRSQKNLILSRIIIQQGIQVVLNLSAFNRTQFKVGFTAITQSILDAEKVHYWSLQHTGVEADFHRVQDWVYIA